MNDVKLLPTFAQHFLQKGVPFKDWKLTLYCSSCKAAELGFDKEVWQKLVLNINNFLSKDDITIINGAFRE
jgi:hypothetical protein